MAICVNVSARQLRSAGFARRLEDILRETGLDPGRLELEITESVIITEPEQTIDMLLRIRDMGVRAHLTVADMDVDWRPSAADEVAIGEGRIANSGFDQDIISA